MSERFVISRRLEAAGFVHAFSLRQGGVSEGVFASLNLGRSVGDDPARVEQNHRLLAADLGLERTEIVQAHQVHGVSVWTLENQSGPVSQAMRTADALVSREKAVGVRTADCLPLLLGDPRTGYAAAVHCGWRGIVDGVVWRALDALRRQGVELSDLVAAIGPHIRVDAFEVGADVADQLARAAPDAAVVRRGSSRPHADLAAVVVDQLTRAGVVAVDDVGGCTHKARTRFFSHRRERGMTGRHLSLIAPRSRA